MDHDVGGQLLQRVQVVPERLLDDVAFLDAGCADMALEERLRRRLGQARFLPRDRRRYGAGGRSGLPFSTM